MRRVVSGFNSPLMGVISATKYGDRSIPGAAAFSDSHWVWERNTIDGKPKPRLITTFEEQREHCKNEKLLNPSEIPRNVEVSSDGKGASTRGMPGQWI